MSEPYADDREVQGVPQPAPESPRPVEAPEAGDDSLSMEADSAPAPDQAGGSK